MADLTDLFKVAPLSAAYELGGQLAGQERTESLKQQQMGLENQLKQQEYGYNEQANPFKLKGLDLGNQNVQSQIDERFQNTRKARLDADLAGATNPGSITATNAKNKLAVTEAQIKEGQALQSFFDRALADAQQIPNPAMRYQHLTQLAAQYNVPADNPQFQNLLKASSQNLGVMQKVRQATATRLAQMTPEFIKEQMKENAATGRNTATNNAHIRVAEIQAEAKKAAAETRKAQTDMTISRAVMLGKIKAPELPAAYREAAQKETDLDLKNYYLERARDAEQSLLNRADARSQPTLDPNGNPTRTKPANAYDTGSHENLPTGTVLPDGSTLIR